MSAIKLAWVFAKAAYDGLVDESSHMPLVTESFKDDLVRIGSTDTSLIFTFRGSDLDLDDWISNIDLGFFREQHMGFYRAFMGFEEIVSHHVKLHLKKQILIRGHSRGGALATHCARFIAGTLRIPVASVITFGCPRLFRSSMRDEYNKLPIYHTNVVNGWDIVAGLPLYSTGFRRVGTTIELPQPFYRRLTMCRIFDHTVEAYDKALAKFDGIKKD